MKHSLLFVLFCLLVVSIMATSCGQQTTKIRVATEATYPPFTYTDEQTSQIVGFDIDLMKAIAQKENLEIEFVVMSFEPLLEGMAQGEYDAAISAISITEERKSDMLFSDPYFRIAHVVTVHKDNTSITGKDSLTGKVVGVEIRSTSASDMGEMEGVTIKNYVEYGSAFDDLMDGVIDAVVSDDTIAIHYVSRNTDKLRLVGEPFNQEYYGIAVAKNKAKLLTKINAGLKAAKSEGLIEELAEKWLPQ